MTTRTDAELDRLRVSDLAPLAPKFRAAVEAALAECHAQGLDAVVFESLRGPALQAAYFARGASKAQSPLGSWHGYGLAVDVISRSKQWSVPDTWLSRVAAIFKAHGCDWGGDWRTFKDTPHFQWGACKASPSDEARRLVASGGLHAVWVAVGAV